MIGANPYTENVLYQLAQTMTGAGRHSAAVALRLLARAGYTTLEQVDAASDWVLLSIRGIGPKRLREVRLMTRPDWRPLAPQAVHTANWFLSSMRFALRYWPPETLVSLIRGSAPRVANGEPIEKRLAIDVLSHAVRQALRHCEAEELVQALWRAAGRPAEYARQTREAAPGLGIEAEKPTARQASTPASELPMTPSSGDRAVGDSDRFAHPRHRRLEIVQDYWAAREQGLVKNKDSWARSHYHISGKTLLSYEREFRD